MQPRGGHLCFDLVTARHNETLCERTESAHNCKTDKNSQKFENSSRNWTDSLLSSASASAPLATSEAWRDDFIGQTLSPDASREKLPKPTREEDATKRKKVTITSSKKEKTKRKGNTNKRKQQSFMSAPDVSLLLARSRNKIPTSFSRVGI